MNLDDARIAKLLESADHIEQFEFCGPSDDPDLQTNVIYGFKHLVKQFIGTARKIDHPVVQDAIADIQLDVESVYDAFDLRSDLQLAIDEIRLFAKNRAQSANVDATVDHGTDFRPEDPFDVWASAETISTIAVRLLFNAIALRIGKPGEYEDRDQLNRDHKLAERRGYQVVSIARQLSLDPSPLVRILREDRLWEYPNDPEDTKVFRAVKELAEKVSVEARIWCAEAGIDVEARLRSAGKPPCTDTPQAPPEEGNAAGEDAESLSADAKQLLEDIKRLSGAEQSYILRFYLFTYAQAYYALVESVATSPLGWVDMELNGWYLQIVGEIERLLTFDELKDFPGGFEPIAENLFPGNDLDAGWEDIIGPPVADFLGRAQAFLLKNEPFGEENKEIMAPMMETCRNKCQDAIAVGQRFHEQARSRFDKILARVDELANARAVEQPNPPRADVDPEADPDSHTIEIEESAFKVKYRGKQSTFAERSKLLFALFAKLAHRPGHQVPFNSLREVGSVWDGSPVEDDTIRGAVKRLRDKLKRDGLDELSAGIRTGTYRNRPYAILDVRDPTSDSN